MSRHFRWFISCLIVLLGVIGIVAASPHVAYAQSIVVNPATLPDGQVGVSYNQTITATGGAGGPYSFAWTAGNLPPGLSLPNTGILSGIPTTAGIFTFTVSGFDCCAGEGTREYTVEITGGAISLSPSTLPDGEVGTAYNQTITASGGADPYTYEVTAGTLPSGLSLDSATGALSGTPTVATTFNFTVTATDFDGRTGNRGYTVIIDPSPLPIISPTTLPDGEVGTPYGQFISATGGEPPYAFTVTTGSLPDGLTLDETSGFLSGTPSTDGSFNFTITATDSNDGEGQQSYTLVINASPITLSPASLPDGTRDTFYSQTITATGGTAPYTFEFTAGTMPGGLTLDPNGTLSGTPAAGGTFAFTVTATDSTPGTALTGARLYSLVINQPGVTISPETLPDGTLNLPYNQSLSVTGGTPPYTVSQGGSLPPGLTFDTGTLLLSGTPTAAGTFNFSVTADDTNGRNDTNNYALTIIDPDAEPEGEEEIAPPPPPVPLCEEHNFDEGGVVRSSTADALGYAINCRVLYQNGSPTGWLGGDLYNAGSIGVEGIFDLGVQQAIDIFSPSGMTYFEGGAVFCLKGSGYLIWLAADAAPRVPEIIGSYEVPEFPGFTCATLFEPGTLVLVSQNPIR